MNTIHTMGGLPNAVRTHYLISGDKENVLLVKLLLLKGGSGVSHTQPTSIGCS